MERLELIHPTSGEVLAEEQQVFIFPAVHYVMPQDRLQAALAGIRTELDERVMQLRGDGKLLEAQRLLAMEDDLHKRVVSQHEAIQAIAKAIRRGRAGLKDPHRPLGSFLFVGPTGVGKTLLAKALAEFMFGEEGALV